MIHWTSIPIPRCCWTNHQIPRLTF
jgi:hypothetical protein